MNLKEFKERIDYIVKMTPKYKSLEEIEVVITTKDYSVGGRAKATIKGIFKGFDWEANQLRIEPSEDLIKVKKDET